MYCVYTVYQLFRTKSLTRSTHGLMLGSVWKRFIQIAYTHLYVEIISVFHTAYNNLQHNHCYKPLRNNNNINNNNNSHSTIITLFNNGLIPRGKAGQDEKLNIHCHLVTRLKHMEIHLHFPTLLQDVVIN
jgi:hypothetical protein